MKYYRIIYNSSQHTQSGSTGFGVRTYTVGTPQEYIDLLQNNDFFLYSSGNMPEPSPNALLEDGKLILRYPVTYSFAKFFVPNMDKEIYVLARTVYVGFDYPYYVKYSLARVGNYVVDAYVFEEMPSAEVFSMLYEEPAEGCAAFVPRNPVPSADNEEMKVLSLDKMELLAPEEKRFACHHDQPASRLAFEILFAYIDAEHKKMPLLVRCEAGQTAALVADLMRLLPRNHQEKAFFTTNYQLEGIKEGSKVFFVNETNPYDYASMGQFVVFDTTQSKTMDVPESNLYRDQLAKLHGEGNKVECDKLVNWLLSPQYAAVRDKSAKTKQVMYDYIVDPGKFNFNDVFSGDDELLSTLRGYFAQDKNNQSGFNKILSLYLEHKEMIGEKLVVLAGFCNKLIGKGFDISMVIENARGVVTTKLVQAPETFKLALDKVGVDGLRKFFDKGILEQHQQLLDDKQLRDDWDKIYKEFYPADKQNDRVGIISRIFTLLLPQNVIDGVVKGFGVDDLQLCRDYAEVAHRDNSLVDLSWKRTWDILLQRFQNRLELPDPNLAADIDRYLVSPLMHDQERQNGVVECKSLVDLLAGNLREDNFDELFHLAVISDTKQTSSLLYEKGMPLLKEKHVEPFMKAVLNNVKPETREFVVRMERHPLKLELLTAFFKQYSDPKECKKAIDRMRKDKTLQISDDECNRLLYGLGIMEDKKKKGQSADPKGSNGDGSTQTKKRPKFLSWLIGAGAVVVAVVVVLALIKSKPEPPTDTKHSVVDSSNMKLKDTLGQKGDTVPMNSDTVPAQTDVQSQETELQTGSETNVDDKTGKVDGESEQTGKEAKKNEPEKEKVQEEVTKDKQDGARQGTIGEPI
jgi:hypothetical protein